MDARAPLPTADIVSTAPTPMVMPSSVSAERIPLRRNDLSASAALADNGMPVSSRGGRWTFALGHVESRVAPAKICLIRDHATVAHTDDPRGKLGHLTVVSNQNHRDPAFHLQLVEDLQ